MKERNEFVRYQQRPLVMPSSFEPTDQLWSPQANREVGDRFDVSPQPSDRYVTVDEIVEGMGA